MAGPLPARGLCCEAFLPVTHRDSRDGNSTVGMRWGSGSICCTPKNKSTRATYFHTPRQYNHSASKCPGGRAFGADRGNARAACRIGHFGYIDQYTRLVARRINEMQPKTSPNISLY